MASVMPAWTRKRRMRAPPSRSVLGDLRETLGLWRLAASLGWLDVKLRYRGSALGPFWLTLSSVVMMASMGVLYARLFQINLHDYLPFLSVSQLLWQFGIANIIQESCTCFTEAENSIRSIRLPFGLQSLRLLVRNGIVIAHNLIVPIGIFALYDAWPGMIGLMSLPGLVLWSLDGFAACLFLGSLCARYRDLPPIVGAVLQVAFYITPVIWKPTQLGAKGWWLIYNPFYPLLEIVRAPLLGHVPDRTVVAVAVGVSVVFCMAALATFRHTRSRLAFWV
ncbi:ABC transporter permease [Brytella acorum]|uniref:ABC transporter permease n=1 Tax=Brytella acorum TaxID=2959299 RepID=A0AA35UYJ6_9PROT|nr:ABC transporter permease [Brytella acorum]MDF3623799.1 ABC transporter permease [Brytella acorum]CAI9121825.1 ABC transporter permease [Brytella acorum]